MTGFRQAGASFSGETYSLNMQSTPGRSVLSGTFENAELYPNQPDGVPGLEFRINNRGCATARGRFVVHEAKTQPINGVSRLLATFQIRCNGRAEMLRGEVSYGR